MVRVANSTAARRSWPRGRAWLLDHLRRPARGPSTASRDRTGRHLDSTTRYAPSL